MLVGRCHEGEQILAFGPWIDAFRGGRLSEDGTLLDTLEPVWRAELARLLPEVGGFTIARPRSGKRPPPISRGPVSGPSAGLPTSNR